MVFRSIVSFTALIIGLGAISTPHRFVSAFSASEGLRAHTHTDADNDAPQEGVTLGIFMQPPAYGGNCATIKAEFEGIHGPIRRYRAASEASGEGEAGVRKHARNTNNNNNHHRRDNSAAQPPQDPQITLPPDTNTTCCVSSYYVRWAEQAGVRVVPIPTDSTPERLRWYMDRVNGVLFTGGIILDDEEVTRDYVAKATVIFNYSVAKYRSGGDRFPLWGTCQGFEILHIVAAGGYDHYNEVLKTNYTGMDPLMLPVTLDPNAELSSAMLADAPPFVIESLQRRNTTLNYHKKGVPPSIYANTSAHYNPRVASFFTPLGVSVDTSGQPFVAAVEGRCGLPIFATQFHPEKPAYDFTSEKVAHDAPTLTVASYFSFFLRSELEKNNHTFASRGEANAHVINNYPVYNVGYGLQYYFV